MTKATIKDVAKLAEVSLKTVSRVINKEPSVSRTKVLIVEDAIKKLGYKPNLAARNLRSTKSYAVALVYDNPNPYYVIDMQNGALNACRDKGYGLQIHPCYSDDSSIAQDLVQLVKTADLAGLLLAPPISERADIISILRDNDVHYVGIVSGSKENDELSPCICVDDRQAAYEITDHLIKEGHTDIAFFWGEEIHKSSPERFSGYQDALKDHHIELKEEFIFEGEYSFESGMKNAEKLIALKQKPSALFCSNDEIAAGALTAFNAAGLTVPHDIAIAGFEDSPFSRHSSPPITTAKQATQSIAEAATNSLIHEIRPDARSKGEEKPKTIYSPSLIIRPSTTGKD
ncbi:LacI family DNA-binding transcriptional regulator [Temperatibacter marinus]|uniref:LacI family DNA-binding transcriptional regulator n=1 Tax=Temperatibacter marinus TaxID=1456591 RepID=A0AA52EKC5_9PROT|nr:LacI family DNA-binding transcriptional regulator [Temperatibacter marinus]WND04084.1 LacI family DNA-binding transcriptional regulator [Temperatibacter marinus]